MKGLGFATLRKLYRKLPWVEQPALACRDLVELVTKYLEGALLTHERLRFEAHLGACPLCARYMNQFRQTIAATGQLREQDLAPEAKEALLSAFRNWKTS